MKGRESNRVSMPTVAAFVDELRAQGLSLKVIFASENGIRVGKKPQGENAFDIPPQYRMEAGNAPRRR
jgi:hypothetical protein